MPHNRKIGSISSPYAVLGLTLVELLVCLAIVSILSFIVIPSFNDMLQNTRANSHINQLSQLIRYTKSEALARQARVTLCPLSKELSCGTQWQLGAMVFIDENNNQIRENNERLLRQETPLISSGTIRFNHPSNRIVFSPQGFPLGNAGSYVYCPENKNEAYARALIINFQGRLRLGRDNDNDGVVETSGQNNVRCT